jgi:hypothetical protein
MEGQKPVLKDKRAGAYLIDQYVKNDIPFPKLPLAFTSHSCGSLKHQT